MKTGICFFSLFALITFPALVFADNGEVRPGDAGDLVIEVLGEPKGIIGSEAFKIFHYDRGNVYLRDGKVERAELISSEQARAIRTAREKRREAQRLRLEMERLERIDEGRSIKRERLADESFLNRPARERLAFWRTFNRHYPEIDISFQMDIARAEVEEEEREREQAMQRERERLALEQRIRDAEARASEAEERAQEMQYERDRAMRYRPYRPISPIYIIQPEPDKKTPDTKRERPSERRVRDPDAPPARERIVPERREDGTSPQAAPDNSPSTPLEGTPRLRSR